MGDGSLSQDEIDALLQGTDDMLAAPGFGGGGDAAPSAGGLSPVERDTLSEVLSATMGAVGPTLSGYLQKNIKIGNALIEVKPRAALQADFPRQYVQVVMDYNGGLSGANVVLLNMNDAGVISALMMGDESGAAPAELSEAHQSTLQEFVSQLLSSAATQLADKIGRPVGTTPPTLTIVNGPAGIQLPAGNDLVKVTYNISIDGLINSKFYHILDMNMSNNLARSAMSGARGPAAAQPQQYQQQQQSMPQQGMNQVGISPVKFPPLGEGMMQGVGGNIGLLLDVQLTLTVELGRTKQLVKDILGLGEGSIIELDKLAGEPVDLLVNNKLIARGEVVVIDENFGVRVTDIVSPEQRITKI